MAASTLYADAYYGPMLDRKDHEVKTRIADYKADAEYDANSIVYMLRIPKGARLLSIDWSCSALGAARTLDIGNATAENTYLSAADVSTAVGGTIVAGIDFTDSVLSSEGYIKCKVEGASLPSAGTLRVIAKYKMTSVIADETAVAT